MQKFLSVFFIILLLYDHERQSSYYHNLLPFQLPLGS